MVAVRGIEKSSLASDATVVMKAIAAKHVHVLGNERETDEGSQR